MKINASTHVNRHRSNSNIRIVPKLGVMGSNRASIADEKRAKLKATMEFIKKDGWTEVNGGWQRSISECRGLRSTKTSEIYFVPPFDVRLELVAEGDLKITFSATELGTEEGKRKRHPMEECGDIFVNRLLELGLLKLGQTKNGFFVLYPFLNRTPEYEQKYEGLEVLLYKIRSLLNDKLLNVLAAS